MIICKRPATSDDHLGEGVHQGDRGDGTEGGEEGKGEGEEGERGVE